MFPPREFRGQDLENTTSTSRVGLLTVAAGCITYRSIRPWGHSVEYILSTYVWPISNENGSTRMGITNAALPFWASHNSVGNTTLAPCTYDTVRYIDSRSRARELPSGTRLEVSSAHTFFGGPFKKKSLTAVSVVFSETWLAVCLAIDVNGVAGTCIVGRVARQPRLSFSLSPPLPWF